MNVFKAAISDCCSVHSICVSSGHGDRAKCMKTTRLNPNTFQSNIDKIAYYSFNILSYGFDIMVAVGSVEFPQDVLFIFLTHCLFSYDCLDRQHVATRFLLKYMFDQYFRL